MCSKDHGDHCPSDVTDCLDVLRKERLDVQSSCGSSLSRTVGFFIPCRACYHFSQQDYSLGLSALVELSEHRHNPSLHVGCSLIGLKY